MLYQKLDGTVAECMCNRKKMILLEREGGVEDTYTVNELKKILNTISIKIEKLKELDYLDIK